MRRLVFALTAATVAAGAIAAPVASAQPLEPPTAIADSGSLADGSGPLGTLPLIVLFFPYAGSAIALGCPLGSGSGTGQGTQDPNRSEHCKMLDNLYFGSA
ncbi:hypothetical protein ACFRAQ_00990 [Nocardia sp. NPDC056611]|uniref:hypothetical protein n=1 Tax=Nocardia sp. NPDC056611 TaxID=3345877 RepID=UPI003670D041